MTWLKNAMHQLNKPKDSVIGVLKKNLGGYKEGRDRSQLHASDITKPNFCPRQWAFHDQQNKKTNPEILSTALAVTFQNGVALETLLVEDWGTPCVVGNWQCRYCGGQRSMVSKPQGHCPEGQRKHWWQYRQIVLNAPEYGVVGSIDALFDIGSPLLALTEVKSMAPDDFEKLMMPLPEHRLRTNLYMKIVESSLHPWRERMNTQEARVLYISRGYGKMNPQWGEIIPFKEFVVKRDDESLVSSLARARQLKIWREEKKMPAPICGTALDKIAKACDCCQACFSGQFPAQQEALI